MNRSVRRRPMNRIQALAGLAIALTSMLNPNTAAAKDGDGEGLRVSLQAGAAVPSENMQSIHDILRNDGVTRAYDVAADIGLSVGGRLRYGLSENLSVVGGIAYHRFAGVEQIATLQSGQQLRLQTTINVTPIVGGIQYFIVRGVVSPYINAELSYTTTTVTLNTRPDDFLDLLQDQGQEIEPRTTRFGGSIAAGIELRTGIIDPLLEFRYNVANLTGREVNELSKSYFTICLGVTL